MAADNTLPWVSNPVAQRVLRYSQIAYPIVLLLLYLIAFTVRSIVTAGKEEDAVHEPEQLGPGGKPLPSRKNNQPKKRPNIPHGLDFSRPRKLLFECLSVAVIFSLGANIVVVIVHALLERNERWWCGEAPTVRVGVAALILNLILLIPC
jgi:hypothetical protein